ncbi:hypothetical protein FQA39_LY19034 [Lamprigera yunnana]|nr:hypothetical protein FQA39_LY19034 [Lamprigera yunnana]
MLSVQMPALDWQRLAVLEEYPAMKIDIPFTYRQPGPHIREYASRLTLGWKPKNAEKPGCRLNDGTCYTEHLIAQGIELAAEADDAATGPAQYYAGLNPDGNVMTDRYNR